jgi:hypothetical protein
MQAVIGRVGGGAQALLVVAAIECAFVSLREPRALIPRQPDVVEPHTPRQQQQCDPDGGGSVPAHAPVPLWPPAAMRLQQRTRDAAALVTDGTATRQGPQARLGGCRRRRSVPPPVLCRLRASQPSRGRCLDDERQPNNDGLGSGPHRFRSELEFLFIF